MTTKSKNPTDKSCYYQSQHSELSTLAGLDDTEYMIEYGDENDSMSKSKSSLQELNWISRFSVRESQTEEQQLSGEEHEQERASNESIPHISRVANNLPVHESGQYRVQDEDIDDDDFENVILKGRNRRRLKSDTTTNKDSLKESRGFSVESQKDNVRPIQNSFLALEEYLDRKEALGEALTCKDTQGQEEQENAGNEQKKDDAPLKISPQQNILIEEVDQSLPDQLELAQSFHLKRKLLSTNTNEGSFQEPKRTKEDVNAGPLEYKVPVPEIQNHENNQEKFRWQEDFKLSKNSRRTKVQVQLDPREEERNLEKRQELRINTTSRQIQTATKYQENYHRDQSDHHSKSCGSRLMNSPTRALNTKWQISGPGHTRDGYISTSFDNYQHESTLSRGKKNKDFDKVKSDSKSFCRHPDEDNAKCDPFERLKKAGSSKTIRTSRDTPGTKRSLLYSNGKDSEHLSQWNIIDDSRAEKRFSLPNDRRKSKPMQQYALSDVTGLGRRKKKKLGTSG